MQQYVEYSNFIAYIKGFFWGGGVALLYKANWVEYKSNTFLLLVDNKNDEISLNVNKNIALKFR